ncbi:MAG: glycosyltransferase [bacterium]
MKICVITSLYKPYAKGGAEYVAENIVNGLVEKGNSVIVITTQPPQLKEKIHPIRLALRAGSNPPSQKEELSVIRFYPCNLFWFGDINKKPLWLRLPWHLIDVFNLHTYFKIKKILKKEKPDVVMTHNLKGIGYTVPMAIRSAGIRHIHTLHDVQLVEPSGLIYQKKYRYNTPLTPLKGGIIKTYSWINKRLFASPNIVISPSEWLMNFYIEKEFFKASQKVIMQNPVLKQLHSKNAKAEGGIKESKNSLNLLYIGQIEDHKGILFLIDALKQSKNVHLDIIGTGTKIDEIKKLTERNNNIKIHGYVKNSLVNTYFVQGDFLIVPSLCAENSPTVIYESFLNSTPVIASNIGGIPELVKNGYNGYIFEAGNKQQLLRIIQKCITEKNEWSELRQNALRSVEGLGIEEYIKKLILETKTPTMKAGH